MGRYLSGLLMKDELFSFPCLRHENSTSSCNLKRKGLIAVIRAEVIWEVQYSRRITDQVVYLRADSTLNKAESAKEPQNLGTYH